MYRSRDSDIYAGLQCSSDDFNVLDNEGHEGKSQENRPMNSQHAVNNFTSPLKLFSRNKSGRNRSTKDYYQRRKELRAVTVIRRWFRGVLLRRRLRIMRVKHKRLAKATRTASKRAGRRLLGIYKKKSYSAFSEGECESIIPDNLENGHHIGTWTCPDPLQLEIALEKACRSQREGVPVDPMSCLVADFYPSIQDYPEDYMCNDTSDFIPINTNSNSLDDDGNCNYPLEGAILC